MKPLDAPPTKATNLEEIRDTLREIASKTVILDESVQIPGWYLTSVFGVHFEWAYLSEPDAAGREKVRVQLIDEDQAQKLVLMAKTHPDAYDLACHIGGAHWGLVGNGKACSESIRCFSAQVLLGHVSRPKRRGRPKGVQAFLRLQQYFLCKWTAEVSSLNLTRNASPSGDSVSACDMVAEAFSAEGMNVTYSQLLDVCQKPNFKEIRDLSDRLFPAPPFVSGLIPAIFSL